MKRIAHLGRTPNSVDGRIPLRGGELTPCKGRLVFHAERRPGEVGQSGDVVLIADRVDD